ncbi:Ig-like domain-containing protein, partial [Staphylococcus sp. EZ-P03]|uniref:Ig-like domain-containing protein n=1 Tax=Staphylococcus sp. EZ-P03 TaxID=2282739 RepID=UPI0019696A66
KATEKDEAGNVSEPGTTVVTDATAPEAPVVSPVTDADTVVSGTGEPNGTVTVTFPDGTTAEAPVDADGNWTVDVPAGTGLKAGDEITATVKDEAGNVSVPGTAVVTDTTAPVVGPIDDVTTPEDQAITPIPVVVTDDSTTNVEVTGLPEGVVYNPETGQIEGTPTTPGTYPVTVTVEDEAGNVTEETFTITVTDETAPEAPVVSPVKDTDTVVSGTGEPNGTVTVTFPDGTTAEAPVDADGNWTVNVPAGTDLKAGDKVTATVTDAAGNTSEPTETTVTTTA